MATPYRRSSRLQRGATPQQAISTPSNNKLSSVLERDDTPRSAKPSIDALMSTPATPQNPALSQARVNTSMSALKTPQTASRVQLPLEEMHPSKVHHSTTKIPRHCGPLSSHPVNDVIQAPSESQLATRNTPSKTVVSLPRYMSSPTFDFSFERPESDLSAEAQRIMDSVREEAAKIKAQMKEEQSKQEHRDGEAQLLFGADGRQLLKPKGKAGRYSDVHKQEFKKMESIANHPSMWKSKLQSATSSLKRSPSKAGLDESPKAIPRSKSFKSFHEAGSDRLENNSPGKRFKRAFKDDTSMARPVSRDSNPTRDITQSSPMKPRSFIGLPSAVTTPTKASLARSVSVKSFKTSMIPSLNRSASTRTLTSPSMPRTEGSNKYLSSLSRFGNMKSILHRPQPKYSSDPSKIAAGTHLPPPKGDLHLDKALPSVPASPLTGTPTIKRVDFSGSTKSRHDLASLPTSPTPSKIPTAYSKHPTLASTPASSDPVTYPILAHAPNITTRTKIPKAPAPGDFTFRSEKTIKFHPTTLASPTSTIRHVRPSGITTPLPPTSFDKMPVIPHGMPNKKRRRPDSDTETEGNNGDENADPGDNMDMDVDRNEADDDDEQPKTKKQRMSSSTQPAKAPERVGPSKLRKGNPGGGRGLKNGGGQQPGKGRIGLSLGRLNVLARPKERK